MDGSLLDKVQSAFAFYHGYCQNIRLFLNMPKDKIDRAVARGAGTGGDAVILEQISYEAYGPGGARRPRSRT